MPARPSAPTVLARAAGLSGELVLRRHGEHFEVVANGVFLMDTRDGRSERLLVEASLAAAPEPSGPLEVVVGGLGVGFSLLEVLAHPTVGRVVVVELEPVLVEWHRGPLAAVTAGALDDPRVQVVCADITAWLAQAHASYDVICLDVDNGPDWLVRPDNAALYDDAGLRALAGALRPGGVAGIWSATGSETFEARLGQHFAQVRTHRVDVARGGPDVVWVVSR
ncbi:MAG TPA: spermidine synthase [Actinomycetes bacterium]|nr:spermidine synthase [Actinomycetes bacterium]